MSNFISTADYDASIHAEILDQLLRKDSPSYDPQIVEICEDRAIAEMRSYLDKIYDCDKIFSATGSDRHPLILMFALDITIYHIFCQHNQLPVFRHEDRCIEWLKGVMNGDVTIDGAPRLPDDDLASNSRWQINASGLRPTLL